MTIIAVNIDEITPMDKVTANPLIGPVPKINNISQQIYSPHINKLWNALDTVRENDMKNEWSSFEGLPWNNCPYQNNDCGLYFDNNDTATIVDISTRYILETFVNQIL